MSEREFIRAETNHFAPILLPDRALPMPTPWTLLTRGAPTGEYSMPWGKRLVRIVLVQAQQPTLPATSNKNHRAARAFALPALALERGEAVGEALAQVAAGR